MEPFRTLFLNDLSLRRVAAKFTLKGQNFIKKITPKTWFPSLKLTQHSSNTSLLETSRGLTWVYEYYTQSRHQASEWRDPFYPISKTQRRFQSKKKPILTVFMDVQQEFLTEGQTVNMQQFGKKERDYRKTTRGFCIMITH